MTRRSWLRQVGGAALAGLAAACGPIGQPPPTTAPTPAPPTKPSGLTPTLANSELAVGRNRFAMALLEAGQPIASASVKYELFQLQGQSGTKRADADAIYRTLDGIRGIYVAEVMFDQPGPWGVQVNATRPNGSLSTARSSFEVLAKGNAPMPGARAIPSHNLTARDVANLSDICSAQPPCDLHDLSVADALSRGRPLMVAFATPGFCTSQTCAPVLGELLKVKTRRAAQADFVHVEIYKDPRNLVVADAVTEWNLQSEPWVFAIDRSGIIAERIESITTADELDATLAPLL